MASSRLDYRVLEATHTQTRRLAYMTAMLSMLGRNSLPERLLLAKMLRWSHDHQGKLAGYWVQTGAMTSTRRNSAGMRYLELASNLGLVASISGECRLTRVGLVLFALLAKGSPGNPFFLCQGERLFYTHLLMEKDADALLTLVSQLLEQPDISLARLQKSYQESFVNRMTAKSREAQEERLKQHLLERRMEVEQWRRPEKYAEHIVPPRLNWLLDLGMLDPESFQHHQYRLTDAGQAFLGGVPRLGADMFLDVPGPWLGLDFWQSASRDLLKIRLIAAWKDLDETAKEAVCAPLLQDAFLSFQSTMVPKASLTQVLLYMSMRLTLEHQIAVGPEELKEWLSTSRVLDGRRYEVRLSPQENVSYIVLLSV